ncbi:SDR family NAD(P)-dependent oxidoreductase, partial [Streptomyces clavuligerus]|uniref:SDR family NAD(P)-dependent oxidoreductase n=1 Tax=Streptomyces clavuligerus TaxID=1901 RepID=UPI001E361CAD
ADTGGAAPAHGTVLVSGGASGIGAACVRRLAPAAGTTVVADTDRDRAGLLVDELRSQGLSITAESLDVRDPDAVAALYRRLAAEHPPVTLLVNSAGISGPRRPLDAYPPEDFDAVVRTGLHGTFHMMRGALPAMRARGGGVVVNIASVAGARAVRGFGPYAAAKHAVIGLTRTAAREYAEYGIRVVSVSPGHIDTPMLGALPAGTAGRLAREVPAGRLGRPEEVADLVAFLGSEQARYITGSDHPVDGGWLG